MKMRDEMGTFTGTKISSVTFAWHFENSTRDTWEILPKCKVIIGTCGLEDPGEELEQCREPSLIGWVKQIQKNY